MVTAAQGKRRRKNTPSSIDRLEPELREMINKLRIDKGFTVSEIEAAVIAEVGKERAPSRSALGRHIFSLSEMQEKVRESQIWTEALAKNIDEEDDKMASVIEQLIQTNILQLLLAQHGGDGPSMDTKQSKEASQAQNYLLDGRQKRQAFIEKKEKRAAEKERLACADRATKTARAKGLSKDTVDAIRHAVLGSDT